MATFKTDYPSIEPQSTVEREKPSLIDTNLEQPGTETARELIENLALTSRLESLNFGYRPGETLTSIQNEEIKPLADILQVFGSSGFELSTASAGAIKGIQRLLKGVDITGNLDEATIAAFRDITGSKVISTATIQVLVGHYTSPAGQIDTLTDFSSLLETPTATIDLSRVINRHGQFESVVQEHLGKLNTIEKNEFDRLASVEQKLNVLREYLKYEQRNSRVLNHLVDQELHWGV